MTEKPPQWKNELVLKDGIHGTRGTAEVAVSVGKVGPEWGEKGIAGGGGRECR